MDGFFKGLCDIRWSEGQTHGQRAASREEAIVPQARPGPSLGVAPMLEMPPSYSRPTVFVCVCVCTVHTVQISIFSLRTELFPHNREFINIVFFSVLNVCLNEFLYSFVCLLIRTFEGHGCGSRHLQASL